MNNKTGLSIVSLHSSVEVDEFSKLWYKKYHKYPGFELSYHMDSQFLDDLRSLPDKIKVLSGHAPCPGGEYLPNFGSRIASVISDSFLSLSQSVDTIASFGGSILVLHAGYTLDSPVFTLYRKRKKVLENYDQNNPYLFIKEGSICSPEYVKSDEYRIHLDEAIENLKKASDLCLEKGVKLAVENLNPRLTYLFQMPEDFIRMTREISNIYICIDIGHLWISSLIHNFNYFDALNSLIATGRVISVHIHDNLSHGGNNSRYSDDHGSIGSGKVPVRESVDILAARSSANLIIEASSDPLKNLELLEELVSKKD